MQTTEKPDIKKAETVLAQADEEGKVNYVDITLDEAFAKAEEEKKLLQQYTNSYNEFLSMSVADSFISGFRLGAKFTHDVFVK